MGYLQLAATAGLGSSGLGLNANPLAPILMALALCAFGYALSLLLRCKDHGGRREQRKLQERELAERRAKAEEAAAVAESAEDAARR